MTLPDDMQAPDFWQRRGLAACVLAPAGAVWRSWSRIRFAMANPWQAPVPVICVGNITVGGAGKTPLVIALARRLLAAGARPHILSRGFGGKHEGPLQVNPFTHDAADVGDEPLLLARTAPTWIGGDRERSAKLAVAAGADVLVMDDGFQNPGLVKTRSILAVDGGYGFGNGLVMPAGPLRETVADGLARADAIVLFGADTSGIAGTIAGRRPIYGARIVPVPDDEIAGQPVFAFAGIARPEKFYGTLRELGCTLIGTRDFPDHHPFTADEIMAVCDAAAAAEAIPVTTEKDWVRLPRAARKMVRVVGIHIEWEDTDALERVLQGIRPDG
jgi:tetraacyldisaccharide 4'-kinase